MTYREKFEKECGTVFWSGCPHDHGYEERPSFYTHCASTTCEACWSREIEEKENTTMKYKLGETVLVQGNIIDMDYELQRYTVNIAGKRTAQFEDRELFELPKPEKTYEQGLKDAWELAKNYEKMSMAERKRIFGVDTIWGILNIFTPQEALAKPKGYEEVRVKVGDVVETEDCKGVVIDQYADDRFYIFTENGCVEDWFYAEFAKTGKHIDIESLLKQIKGDSNE